VQLDDVVGRFIFKYFLPRTSHGLLNTHGSKSRAFFIPTCDCRKNDKHKCFTIKLTMIPFNLVQTYLLGANKTITLNRCLNVKEKTKEKLLEADAFWYINDHIL
jgi:hypothetical protein